MEKLRELTKAISEGGEICEIAERYRLRARIYEEKKDYNSAMADYMEAAKLIKWSMDYEAIARLYERKRDYDSAIAFYTKGIRAGMRCGDGRAESYFGRGKVYFKLKNYDAAISDLKKSIRDCFSSENKCKGCADCYNMIGKAYLAKGKESEPEKKNG
jgi:tetratricopeptide (TPR) repeat protein